ncbi:UNVERIFIED_CONTAM: Retrovirus-related Pol polyprotein from transposon TNT 1-94 [Sesamum latifolium]|uniref:Retrovirus-related Pol polyprotein from transposon TNT 1-94 n=1 Tax=Sesamum latifolium TaxID=2727402 RepID=A0AAW2UI53_9LAMI
MDTVRMIIALAAQKDWKIFQLDVKSAFLHDELREDVYVEQPRGYEKKGSEHLVYKLYKALYGLKQAPRAWFSRIEVHFNKEGTVNYGIYYKKEGELLAFTDSDYAGDVDDRKSTSGYVFLMSSGAVSWCSKKQPIVTLSTAEAEFVAATVCACQGILMKRILKELGYFKEVYIAVMCDNSSTIKLSKNPIMHGRSKHIDVRYHFLRNLTKGGALELVYYGSQDQVADIMT